MSSTAPEPARRSRILIAGYVDAPRHDGDSAEIETLEGAEIDPPGEIGSRDDSEPTKGV